MIQREPQTDAEHQWATLNRERPNDFGPLGSMVLVYCIHCHSQSLCDERGCIVAVRAQKRDQRST
jgi:hypothetical protein